jgi:hypothetical protein
MKFTGQNVFGQHSRFYPGFIGLPSRGVSARGGQFDTRRSAFVVRYGMKD